MKTDRKLTVKTDRKLSAAQRRAEGFKRKERKILFPMFSHWWMQRKARLEAEKLGRLFY